MSENSGAARFLSCQPRKSTPRMNAPTSSVEVVRPFNVGEVAGAGDRFILRARNQLQQLV